MEIKLFFNNEEITSFLQSNGYTIENRKKSYWNQWGNHDSSGEWVEIEKPYVIKDDQIIGEVNNIFHTLITEKIKNILLK